MKRFLFHALVVAFLAAPAFADLYQWNDERGVIHITDSMEKVPSKFRGGVRVIKEGPSEAPAPEEEAAPAGDNGSVEDTTTDLDQAAPPAEEIYGDEPLGWWTQSFQDKRAEISGLQESIDAKISLSRSLKAAGGSARSLTARASKNTRCRRKSCRKT
jgi:hypothetical protein